MNGIGREEQEKKFFFLPSKRGLFQKRSPSCWADDLARADQMIPD